MANARIRPVRFNAELNALIDAETVRRRVKFSDWVRQAVIEKLRHSARSRGVSVADFKRLEATLSEGRPPIQMKLFKKL